MSQKVEAKGSGWAHTPISYPRSSRFQEILDDEEYFVIANSAERTDWDFHSEKAQSAKRYMTFIDTGFSFLFFSFFVFF